MCTFCLCLWVSSGIHMLNNHCVPMSRLLYTHMQQLCARALYIRRCSRYGKLWGAGVFSTDILLPYLKAMKEKRSARTILSHLAQLARLAGEKAEAQKAPGLRPYSHAHQPWVPASCENTLPTLWGKPHRPPSRTLYLLLQQILIPHHHLKIKLCPGITVI